jgi:TfoX/Sxy family transcriptional regulator of competence genes
MAYDEDLAQRTLHQVEDLEGVTTRKMFGGYAIMLRGNMLVGVVGDDLMARVGPVNHDEFLQLPGARPMDFSGRPMKGMLYISGAAVTDPDELAEWIVRCRDFVEALPPK